MFITFEGTEGSGKSTQVRLLAKWLAARGNDVLATREPGGTALGEELRAILLDREQPVTPATEMYLMTAARAEHVAQVIRPALERGVIVLSDRYADSTFAYQGGGRGLDLMKIEAAQELALDGVWPDLTLLLDLDVAAGLRRRHDSLSLNRMDRESLAFHERVAFWYRQAVINDPGRWVRIDAERTIEEVHEDVISTVRAHLARPQKR